MKKAQFKATFYNSYVNSYLFFELVCPLKEHTE